MSSNIFGPQLERHAVENSGESGHHYYFIESDKTVYVDSYQQYPIHIRNYLSIDGTIDIDTDGEVIIGEI